MEREARVRDLLAQLNEWAKIAKTSHSGDQLAKDKGEANARIADLKAKLGEMGAAVRWNGTKYVLESAPGSGSGQSHGKR